MDNDFDQGATRAADDRPRGVSKTKLGEINLEPKMSIFFRPDRNSPMIPMYGNFSKEAATTFCDRIYKELERSKGHLYVITGGDQAAYRQIFDWINDCAQMKTIEKFPDIPEPEDDPFSQTINIIIAGESLGVPAGSLSYHLKKRLNGCARKNLMPFSQVREFYDQNSEAYGLGLKDVACTSVFSAWWDARIDESVDPIVMEDLADLRDEIYELDEDLHHACETREEEIRKKWAEKKAKKDNEQIGGGEFGNPSGAQNTTTNDGWGDTTTAATDAGDWDSHAPSLTQATSPTDGGWDNPITKSNENDSMGDWSTAQKPTDQKGHDIDQSGADTWADEMNEPSHESIHIVPTPQW